MRATTGLPELLARVLRREAVARAGWVRLLQDETYRSATLMPALRQALRKAGRRATPSPVAWDLAVVGGGVIGSAVAFAAVARGLRTVVVTRSWVSESFRFGEAFALNTWNRAPRADAFPPGAASEQHPGLVVSPWQVTHREFPDGGLLRDLALCTLWASGAQVVQGEVTTVESGTPLVIKRMGGPALWAAAVIACPGFGQNTVNLGHRPSAAVVRKGLAQHSRVLGFHEVAGRFVRGTLGSLGDKVLLVGSGPSGVSVLEMLWRVAPPPQVTWLTGPGGPSDPQQLGKSTVTGVCEMFERRYAAVRARAERRKKTGALVMHAGTVDRVVSSAKQVNVEVGSARFVGDSLIWAGGMRGDFSLVGETQPKIISGAKVALQRVEEGQLWPVFGVGPSLDQLGYGEWPTGPLSEWVRKALMLVEQLP